MSVGQRRLPDGSSGMPGAMEKAHAPGGIRRQCPFVDWALAHTLNRPGCFPHGDHSGGRGTDGRAGSVSGAGRSHLQYRFLRWGTSLFAGTDAGVVGFPQSPVRWRTEEAISLDLEGMTVLICLPGCSAEEIPGSYRQPDWLLLVEIRKKWSYYRVPSPWYPDRQKRRYPASGGWSLIMNRPSRFIKTTRAHGNWKEVDDKCR